MKRFSPAAVCAFIVATVFVAVSARAGADEAPYQQQKNIVYGETDGVGLVMDVFVPTAKKNGLAVVDVASGGWSSDRGKINDHKRAQMFDILCGRGYVVFAVRPGSSSKFSVPEMVDHLKLAIRWVKAHADEYGIDPDRLAMTGASAGGHLTCLTCATPEDAVPDAKDPLKRYDTRVKVAVAFFPPTDFLDYGGRKFKIGSGSRIGRMIGRLLFSDGVEGKSEEEIQAQLKKVSPARLVTSDFPPILLIHGDADLLVPLQQSKKMLKVLQDAGVEAKLIIKPGGGHPWPTIHEEVAVAADWIDEHLGVKPAAEEAASKTKPAAAAN